MTWLPLDGGEAYHTYWTEASRQSNRHTTLWGSGSNEPFSIRCPPRLHQQPCIQLLLPPMSNDFRQGHTSLYLKRWFQQLWRSRSQADANMQIYKKGTPACPNVSLCSPQHFCCHA
eukprot:1338511-Amphidinium_carterae.2